MQIRNELVLLWEGHGIPVKTYSNDYKCNLLYQKLKSTIMSSLPYTKRPLEMNRENTILIRKSAISKLDILFDISRCNCFVKSKSREEIIFENCKCEIENKIPMEKFGLYKENFQLDLKVPKKSEKEKWFTCNLCHQNVYGNQSLFNTHIINHYDFLCEGTPKRPFFCLYCNIGVRNEKQVQTHEKSKYHNKQERKTEFLRTDPLHTDRRKLIIFKCDFCQKSYNQSLLLEEHVRLAHVIPNVDDIKEIHKCQACKKTFMLKKELSRHFHSCQVRIEKKRQREGYDNSCFYDEKAMDSVLSEIIDFDEPKEQIEKDPDYIREKVIDLIDPSKVQVKIVDDKHDCEQCKTSFCNKMKLQGMN